jgi:hypothetical protein
MKLLVVKFLAFTFIILSACSKDSDPSNTELITRATWKYKNAGVDLNSDGVIDTNIPPGYLMDCDKDNLITFESDGTGVLDEGAIKCDPANPQTSDFSWSFKNNETIINFPTAVFSGLSGDLTIIKLTETEFNVYKEGNIGGPTPVRIVLELTH